MNILIPPRVAERRRLSKLVDSIEVDLHSTLNVQGTTGEKNETSLFRHYADTGAVQRRLSHHLLAASSHAFLPQFFQ